MPPAVLPTRITIVLGIVLVLTGIIVRAISQSHPVVTEAQPRSVASKIAELTQLRDEGLITQEEFASKREALISQMQ